MTTHANLNEMTETLARLHATLIKLTERLDSCSQRADIIAKQHKRKLPIRDTSFETDFKAILDEVKTYVEQSDDFWKEAAALQRKLEQGDISCPHIDMKNFVAHARTMNREIDKFCSVFRFFQQEAKPLPFKLNWWMFDAYCKDMEKISGKILFTSRELSKLPVEDTPGNTPGAAVQ